MKILFVGAAESSHTYAWIELLNNDPRFEARLFGTPGAGPEEDCPVPAYNTCPYANYKRKQDRSIYPVGIDVIKYAGLSVATGRMHWLESVATWWLKRVVKSWKPDIVHTLGVYPAGTIYAPVHDSLPEKQRPKWVVQMRGGSDTALNRYSPGEVAKMKGIFDRGIALLTDNFLNIQLAREWGMQESKVPQFQAVPGTGGLDPAISDQASDSKVEDRRMILWPKAYECWWSKTHPVFAALASVWEKITPCRIVMLKVDAETRAWISALPRNIRDCIEMTPRIPRGQVMGMMGQARVMLAPTLVDGTPNSMFEAMAYGALPIVSPLETITPIVRDREHVLFARNLYPDEIAAALVTAMNDVDLLRDITRRNREYVKVIANRDVIRSNAIRLYLELLAGKKAADIPMEQAGALG